MDDANALIQRCIRIYFLLPYSRYDISDEILCKTDVLMLPYMGNVKWSSLLAYIE